MQQIKDLIKQMTKVEQIGTLIFILSLLIVQFTTGNTVLGLATGTLGIFYVILVRLGSKLCYIVGGIQMALYVLIAYNSKIYGDTIFNSINVLLQFVGWYKWSRREDTHGIVKPKKMSRGKFGCVVAIWIIAWICGSIVLTWKGGNTPYLDSFTTVTVMIAMLLSINSYKEQWILWNSSNIIEVVIWSLALIRGESNALTMVIMWIAYFCNSLLGYKHWNDLYKENNTK